MKIIAKSIYSVILVLLFYSVIITGCKKEEYENDLPVAKFSISSKLSSTLGYVDTLFTFDASFCFDDRTPTSQLMVRWDFDGDGTYDADWSTNKSSFYKYAKDGVYKVNLEVKDEDGEVSFESKSLTVILPTFTDSRDNKTYETVIIGNQVWMAENLAYETPGKEMVSHTEWVNNEAHNGWCYFNNDKTTYDSNYGVLYQWRAAQDACPSGWHIPSKKECDELRRYLESNKNNGFGTVGKAIASSSYWEVSLELGDVGNNQASNNRSGFNALPTGLRIHVIDFAYSGEQTRWWTSDHIDSNNAYGVGLAYHDSEFISYISSPVSGYSVRCVRD